MRHQLLEPVADVSSVRARAQHLKLAVVELREELAAGAAGHTVILALGVNGDADIILEALADRLDAGGALGANGVAQRRVLDVAAGKDSSAAAFKRCADGEL